MLCMARKFQISDEKAVALTHMYIQPKALHESDNYRCKPCKIDMVGCAVFFYKSEVHISGIVVHGPATTNTPDNRYLVCTHKGIIYFGKGILMFAYNHRLTIYPDHAHVIGSLLYKILFSSKIKIGICERSVKYQHDFGYG